MILIGRLSSVQESQLGWARHVSAYFLAAIALFTR